MIFGNGRVLAFTGDGAGGAEVNELHAAVGQKQDVFRADIPVDEAAAVDGGQAFGQRKHGFEGGLFIQRSLFFHPAGERFAFDVFHNDVGGCICLEIVQNADDARQIGIVPQCPCLAKEALPLGSKGGGFLGITENHAGTGFIS